MPKKLTLKARQTDPDSPPDLLGQYQVVVDVLNYYLLSPPERYSITVSDEYFRRNVPKAPGLWLTVRRMRKICCWNKGLRLSFRILVNVSPSNLYRYQSRPSPQKRFQDKYRPSTTLQNLPEISRPWDRISFDQLDHLHTIKIWLDWARFELVFMVKKPSHPVHP